MIFTSLRKRISGSLGHGCSNPRLRARSSLQPYPVHRAPHVGLEMWWWEGGGTAPPLLNFQPLHAKLGTWSPHEGLGKGSTRLLKLNPGMLEWEGVVPNPRTQSWYTGLDWPVDWPSSAGPKGLGWSRLIKQLFLLPWVSFEELERIYMKDSNLEI